MFIVMHGANIYDFLNLLTVKWIEMYKKAKGDWRVKFYWDPGTSKDYVLSEEEAKELFKTISEMKLIEMKVIKEE